MNNNDKLTALEMKYTALNADHQRLRTEFRLMAKCVAEFQELYGASIKATAGDRAFIRGIWDKVLERSILAAVWGFVLFLTACLGVGALYFWRAWLGYFVRQLGA